MIDLETHAARVQPALSTQPYDRWVTAEGEVKAEFHRLPDGILLRFPEEADFAIDLERGCAAGWPAPDTRPEHFDSLFRHGVVPMVGNHLGGLFLHGSAVAINGRAVAFLGLPRSGKTTLAGAMAKAGYPFLTEDVIDLERAGDGSYILQPKASLLRLFGDSAAFLLDRSFDHADADDKLSLAAGDAIPFSDTPCQLDRIYLLGRDKTAALSIQPLGGHTALAQLLPHAFVLDVEDKPRLKGHFGRIAELAERIGCRTLDYPRRYEDLAAVMGAILADLQSD